MQKEPAGKVVEEEKAREYVDYMDYVDYVDYVDMWIGLGKRVGKGMDMVGME